MTGSVGRDRSRQGVTRATGRTTVERREERQGVTERATGSDGGVTAGRRGVAMGRAARGDGTDPFPLADGTLGQRGCWPSPSGLALDGKSRGAMLGQ